MAGIALGRRVAAAARGFLLEPASGAPAAESVANRTESEDGGRPDPAPPVILATALAGSGGAMSVAAAVGVAIAAEAAGRAVLAVDLDPPSGGRGPTMLASESARELEDELRAAGGPFGAAAARGNLCYLPLPPEADPSSGSSGDDPLDRVAQLLDRGVAAAAVVVNAPPDQWTHALADERLRARGGLMRAELPADRSLAALAVRELHDRGMRAAVVSRPLGRVASRRALAGIEPGGAASRRGVRLARRLLAAQTGQSLPLVLGAAAAIIFTAVVLTAIGGAVTAKGRVQRAADLAALSGARSMRDDFERLFAPAFRAGGTPNPAHLTKTEYLARARAAARGAAGRNDVPADRVRIRFPDADTFAPLTVRARVVGELERDALPGPVDSRGDRNRRDIPVEATAEAEASAPAGWSGMPTTASGGGYSGPLVYRQGEGMRPDVAEAFDRMAAAARRDGLHLLINSGFRSDAEQAELFEQNPNPTMVAPPGKSLHRCATELDLGPPSAYGWLAQNARRFGFLKRYSWEPWHFGFVDGPPPCSEAGNSIGAGGDGESARTGGLPSFVPARYREPILRAAARWNVSAALIAAQIMAESNFDPNAVSPAGAQGIAQFMPGTAASYGLDDPFDPEQAINAQAHLMSDLLRQFRSIPLALAAYNAGPGAVAACDCVPPYPETRAYVARILGLLDGAGAVAAPPLEVRLVR
jgi:Transglycosylase SLT domain/D-alanyl-D-alanine carboxypeptidase/Putative Flp pilus-assembly TadE/G-like